MAQSTISRRDFIHAGCAIGAASLVPNVVEAALHGSATGNSNRGVINASTYFANLAKGFAFNIDPANSSANGYPVTTPAAPWGSNPAMPGNYFGTFTWSWTGTGSMQVSNSPPMLVTTATNTSLAAELAGGNVAVISAANPTIVFQFGINIQSITDSGISNGAGGTFIKITGKTGYGTNVSSSNVVVANITGIATQTNANGTWGVTAIDANSFYLNGSTWSAGQGAGGVAGQAIFQAINLNVYMLNSGTFSSMNNLIWCKTSLYTQVQGGQINDPLLITQHQYLFNHAGTPMSQRGWLRFMDWTQVQGSWEHDFANRKPANYLSYASAYFPAAYWAGNITNGGGDAYTCANPSGSGGGAYVDLETVQGVIGSTNTAGNPTLNVGGRGAKPIFDSIINQMIFSMSAPPVSAGLNMVFTFTASWLNGGTPYAFTYTTVSGDTGGVGTLNGNIATAINVDSVLRAALVTGGNSGQVTIGYRTAQAGVLTVSYSGPAICTIIRLPPSALATGNASFTYNVGLGGWTYLAGGLNVSTPLEGAVEFCNQTGAHCWFNWPVNTTPAYITAVTNYFATNLTSGLRFATEFANEVWLAQAQPFGRCLTLGSCYVGALTTTENVDSYRGVRTVQYASYSRAAWAAAGKPASDHYILLMGSSSEAFAGHSQNFDVYSMAGADLVMSNPVYSNYSGFGTVTPAAYNTAPKRPADIITATGMATYWYSDYIGEVAAEINGTTTDNATWLQASKDYANGLSTTAFTAMVNMFSVQRAGLDTNHAGNWTTFATLFGNFELLVEEYDAARLSAGAAKLGILHYEGGPQWSFDTNLTNGTNSAADPESLSALTLRMGAGGTTPGNTSITGLGWNVSAYTLSGTDNKTEMAKQVLTMTQAWKQDVSYKNMIKQNYYQALVNASAGKGREVRPAQYGYDGNTWGLFPVSYTNANPYTNYDAIHEFNA